MTLILSTFVRYGRCLAKQLSVAALNLEAAQLSLLHSILAPNADTVFGREHKFSQIKTTRDYYKFVPVRDYEGFRPYVDLTMCLYPERRWFGEGTIPIIFHFVLAGYLFTWGKFYESISNCRESRSEASRKY